MNEQEIKNRSEELKKEIIKLSISKNLNFLIGSGCSMPAIPTISSNTELKEILGKVKEVSEKLINGNYKKACNHSDEESKNICKTFLSYKNFIQTIVMILKLSNPRLKTKNVNIFTTNYDLFIEKSIDILLENHNFSFNDGSRGYFKKYIDITNYNKTLSYRGINDNYMDIIPTISIIKPHGSINWEKEGTEKEDNEKILIKNNVVNNPFIVTPIDSESKMTFYNDYFFDMLRFFQLELDKPQSVLFIIGFSLGDKYIAKMIKRGLENPELRVYCFCYENKDEDIIKKNLYGDQWENTKLSNINFITPKKLGLNEKGKITIDNFSQLFSDIFEIDSSNIQKHILKKEEIDNE